MIQMKRSTKLWIAALSAALILAALGYVAYTSVTVLPIAQDPEDPYAIHRVTVGLDERPTDPAVLDSLAEVLFLCSGTRSPLPLPSHTLEETTICLDGRDAEGGAYLILEPDRAIFYRSAQDGYVLLHRPETLYRIVSGLLGLS